MGELYEMVIQNSKLKPDLKEAEKWHEILKDEKALVQMGAENPSETS